MHASRLYSFLDHKEGFAIHFFEGQKLIHDLALLHQMTPSGFAYFRDVVLSVQPLITFLNIGENFGFYIDSNNPYFKFKLESNHNGNVRTLLIPEDLKSFPDKLTGLCRLIKLYPNKTPYSSVIDMNEMATKDIINQVLEKSFQTQAEVVLGNVTDQSILISKLPRKNIDSSLEENKTLKEYLISNKSKYHQIFDMNLTEIEDIVENFEDLNLAYLNSKEVKFFCGCSLQGMIDNLNKLANSTDGDVFEGDPHLDLVCDYCKKSYRLTPKDLKKD